MKTKLEAVAALKTLRPFIGANQLYVIAEAMRGEEKQYFFDMVCELAERIAKMPATREQDGKGDQAIAWLHYFGGGTYSAYITEKDCLPEQQQAFGLAHLGPGNDPELGYISIQELLANNAEIDLYWDPMTLAEVKCEITLTCEPKPNRAVAVAEFARAEAQPRCQHRKD